MRLTVTSGADDVTVLELFDGSLEALAEHLATHEVGEKEGEALIPAVFINCQEKCRGTGMDCGGDSPHRLNANVTCMTALAVDLDHLTAERLNEIIEGVKSRGLAFYWWNTYQHKVTPKENWVGLDAPLEARARLLIPFLDELPIDSQKQWRAQWATLMQHFGFSLDRDKSCSDLCRVYYLPRKPLSASPHVAEYSKGALFDWKPVLGSVSAVPKETASTFEWDGEDESRPVDLEAVKKDLAGIGKEPTATFLGRVLKGEAPVGPPNKRAKGEPSRYEAWRSVTHQVALCAEGWMSTAALAEILRPAWSSEVADSPHDHSEWERVVNLLGSARGAAEAYKHQKNQARAKMQSAMLKRSPGVRVPRAIVTGAKLPTSQEGESEDDEARREAILQSMLERAPSKKEGEIGPIRASGENIAPILAFHPDWFGSLKLNRLTNTVEIWGGPLLSERDEPGRPLRESDIVITRDWFARSLQLRFPDNSMLARLVQVAEEYSYDPLQDYLSSLQWDGTDRLTDFLVRYFGAVTVDLDVDVSEYVRAIGKKWLISAVARALQPGCKVDTILELEGLQGTGKSTALRILGGQFFTDAPIKMSGDKDSLMLISKAWIVELGEMAAFGKSDAAAQKDFISRPSDSFRPPYAKIDKTFPRRCVLAATGNENQYLNDHTGNRRHWPVETTVIDLEGLRRDRDQIWAEAVARYRAGETWQLETQELRDLANMQTKSRMAGSTMSEQIHHWYLSKEPAKRPEGVTTREVCTDILEVDSTRGLEIKIGNALRALGFTKKRVRKGHTLTWVYEAPSELLTAAKESGLTTAQKIAQARGMQVMPGGKKEEKDS